MIWWIFLAWQERWIWDTWGTINGCQWLDRMLLTGRVFFQVIPFTKSVSNTKTRWIGKCLINLWCTSPTMIAQDDFKLPSIAVQVDLLFVVSIQHGKRGMYLTRNHRNSSSNMFTTTHVEHPILEYIFQSCSGCCYTINMQTKTHYPTHTTQPFLEVDFVSVLVVTTLHWKTQPINLLLVYKV